MPFELFVALRYLREGRIQTALILTGIAVGVGVIVFLSALITGLQDSLIDRTLGSQALVVVRAPEVVPRALRNVPDGVLESVDIERAPRGVRSIEEWRRVADVLRDTDGVTAVAPAVDGPGIAVRGVASRTVNIRGIEPESYRPIVDVAGRLVDGSLDLDGFAAVVGRGLAEDLGVGVGGRIRLQVAGDRGGVYTVMGIAEYGSTELDQRLIFVSLPVAQTLFDLPGGVSSLELRTADVFAAEEIAGRIAERTGLEAESWIARNEDLLIGLRSQSLSSVMIQVFVVIAVALGIASVLSVSVVQRAREIGILRATGTRSGAVHRIFLIEGAILGMVGAAFGIGIGVLLSLGFQSVAQGPDGAALFPVDLNRWLFLRSVAVAVGVGILSAWIPARNAAAMDPATVIRNG
jgi:lipoprotein-releasing system permease protein